MLQIYTVGPLEAANHARHTEQHKETSTTQEQQLKCQHMPLEVEENNLANRKFTN